jgi:hypothetical protein
MTTTNTTITPELLDQLLAKLYKAGGPDWG